MREHAHSLRYWLRHKWFVFIECCNLGVPLWIAILHDWDKLLSDEWFPYANMRINTGGSSNPQTITAFQLAQCGIIAAISTIGSIGSSSANARITRCQCQMSTAARCWQIGAGLHCRWVSQIYSVGTPNAEMVSSYTP